MEAITALQETSPLVSWGVPEEVKQIASWDVSRQFVAQVNETASEMDLTGIEREFLETLLLEQAECNGIDERAEESEWQLFLKNLSPPTPTEHNNDIMEEHGGPQKEDGRRCGNSSPLGEWDVLLDRLSHLETSVVQQILGHVESDVLREMLQFMHLRMIQDKNPGGSHCEESIALSGNKEDPLVRKNHKEHVQEEHEMMQYIPELDSQLVSDTRSVTKEIPMSEKQQESNPETKQSICHWWTDIGEEAKWDPLGNSSHHVESKLEETETLQVFQQLMPQLSLLPRLSPSLEQGELGISKQLEQNMNFEPEPEPVSQVATLQGFQQVPQNLVPEGESDQEGVEKQLQPHIASEPGPKPFLNEMHTGRCLDNSESRWTCSQQIESKLAEIPTQIASTIFMRTPLIMDLNLLHQLFRQIDQILFQVMPHHILFDSVLCKKIKAHVHWHDCSLRRIHLDDSLEYSKLLNPQHRHQFQPTEILKAFQQTPKQNEFTNGLRLAELDQMPHQEQDNQTLNCHDVDSNNHMCENSSDLWSAVLEYSSAVPNYLQLLPQFMLNGSMSESQTCPKLDAISFITSRLGGGTWNTQMIVTKPPPTSTHPLFLLNKLPQPEWIEDLQRLPQVNSDQHISQLLPITNDIITEICQDIDSSHHIGLGLPPENRQVQKHMPSQIDTDYAHLLPQDCVEQTDQVELHALRQNMCLTVLQQIAKQVEYNISQGLPLEINAALLEALDLQPEDYWLQPCGQETESKNDYFDHKFDECWDFHHQECDIDTEACPENSQQTDNFTDFRELHEDMRQTLESSTSGWTSEPSSETDSPLYYLADPARKVYHRNYSYKDTNVDSLGLPYPRGKCFNEFEEFLHFEEFQGSTLEEFHMPVYTPPPLGIFYDIRQYVDMVTKEHDLEDGFERSPDYMSSLNFLWVPEQELQQQSEFTQELDDEIGDTIDFYLEGLAGTASDLIWFLDTDENLRSAAVLQEQEDIAADDLPYDLGVLGDLEVDEDLSGSSAEHMVDSNEAEELFLEATDSSSRSSHPHDESETSTTSWDEAEQLQANARLQDAYCSCYQAQLLEAARLHDSLNIQSLRLPQRRKSVEWNPQISSVISVSESWDRESNPGLNSDQHDDHGIAASNPAQKTGNVHYDLGSESFTGAQHIGRRSELQINTSSSTEECVEDQEAAASGSLGVSSSELKLTNGSMTRRAPTISQFHDPSTPVRHTIFGLLVLAGGLYLVENRDQIEQQSISAAEAAAEAWRWLGNFIIRTAKGEFDK
ncbi:unnamed protein product [Calypogeia fissa]